MYGVLHGYEITLRNAMHDRLMKHFGRDDWYSAAKLNKTHLEMVAKAQADASFGRTSGWPIPVGKVVAELSLGFWTGLIAAGYEQSLWQSCLRKAFPSITIPRKKAYPLLNDIKSVRNRVAHHERILGSNGTLYAGLHPIRRTELTLRPQSILDCIAWICPRTSQWVRETAQFDTCLQILTADRIKHVSF